MVHYNHAIHQFLSLKFLVVAVCYPSVRLRGGLWRLIDHAVGRDRRFVVDGGTL